ncbi:hypothetical protein FQN54_008369 [Arachnomyces sp. PD_36]|nr:hypothetical protein FQN54_008369 [Arachnomyces sp. PD_36]
MVSGPETGNFGLGRTMSSHKSDRNRRQRFAEADSYLRDTQLPMTSVTMATGGATVPRPSRLQNPGQGPYMTGRRRGSSVSESGSTTSVMAPVSQMMAPQVATGSRPSGLPRPSGNASASSLPVQSTNKRTIMPSPQVTTTITATKSSAPRQRNVLRRKAPSIEQYAERTRSKSNASESDHQYRVRPTAQNPLPSSHKNPSSESFFEGQTPYPRLPSQPQLPPQQQPQKQKPQPSQTPISNIPTMKQRTRKEDPPVTQIPELAGLSRVNTHNLPPPTPNFNTASSPSTRYSDSPGPWSSRNSTPTSLSSYSPGIVYPTKIGRARQPSPTRSRTQLSRQTPELGPSTEYFHDESTRLRVPNSSTPLSSHSNSSTNPEWPQVEYESSKVTRTPPAPTPPPRKSSVKFKSPSRRQQSGDSGRPSEERGRSTEHGSALDSSPGKRNRSEHVAQTSISRPSPVPSRPSRDGIEELQFKPSPVIQSNIVSPIKVSGHKRRESSENSSSTSTVRPQPTPVQTSIPVPSFSKSSTTSRLPSRYNSPSPQEPVDKPTAPRPTHRSVRSESRQRTLTKERKEPAAANSDKRFGLFSKRSKTVPDVTNPERPARRGPAAGTGHEGYGRYAHRGRKSSVGGSTSRGRSTSTTGSVPTINNGSKTSLNSRGESDIDDFLLQRLEPVIISGGGADGGELSRTQSEQSISTTSVASTAYSRSYVQSPQQNGYSSESLVSSASRFEQAQNTSQGQNTSKMTNENQSHIPVPGLQKRRSLRRSQIFKNKGEAKPLASIDTNTPTFSPPINSYDTTLSSIAQSSTTNFSVDNETQEKKEVKPKKSDRWGKSKKWNFFQRSNGADRKEQVAVPNTSEFTELQATISQVPSAKPVAHYALVDAEQSGEDTLEDILHQTEVSPSTEDDDIGDLDDVPGGLEIKKPREESVLLPAPPVFGDYPSGGRPSSPKVFFNKDIPEVSVSKETQQPKVQEERPSRLAPVGRIPRVVSRRDREHRPALQSFSRPFSVVESPPITVTAGAQPNYQAEPSRPALEVQTDVLPSRPFHDYFGDTKPYSAPVAAAQGDPTYPCTGPEFLAFSPRKGSEVSGSSSSEGKLSLAAVTAVLPEPGSNPTEDEVWGEFDDLIDHVLSPKKPKPPQLEIVLPNGEPFQMATRASRTLQAELSACSDETGIHDSPTGLPEFLPPDSLDRYSAESVHLRRSRIVSALHSSIGPSTPGSVSDRFADFEERNKSGTMDTSLDSSSSYGRSSYQSTVTGAQSVTPSTSTEVARHRNTLLMDSAERDRHGAVSPANLRSGSLMTSRWLSFGRVLFSPAHNHIKDADQERILVIDGLGNDDWSFYCALSYPTATVYNLSIAHAAPASANPAAWQPPSNHHTVHHSSLESPFPFPKGFFAVTVFRFPSSCPEAGQRNAISECKRVLRPGGYIEMSVLDLDMLNMGNRTRKAVRMLKERTWLEHPEVSLKPASDNLQKLLGKKGFQNLNRCMVGVPVAGTVVNSSDSTGSYSSNSATRGGPSISTTSTNGTTQKWCRESCDSVKVSLGDLLSDPSPSPANDESIAKMVAKVGRWWYTRCYEMSVLPDGDLDQSIWADGKVLRECRRRGTGFRLLIAYAQNPSEVNRRTASV